MKTAMQELIDDLKNLKKSSKERNQYGSFEIGMNYAIARAELRLEKEKVQNLNLIRFMRTNDKMGKSTEDLYNEFLTRIVYEMV